MNSAAVYPRAPHASKTVSTDSPMNHPAGAIPVAAGMPAVSVPTTTTQALPPAQDAFFPPAPTNIEQTGLTKMHVEELLLKALFNMGAASSRQLANQIKLAGPVVREVLESLRSELLVTYKGTADLVDYVFQLTANGINRAEQLARRNTYYGATPVMLSDYLRSVDAQSLAKIPLRLENIHRSLNDLYLTAAKLASIAEAVNANRGMFLFGTPGNGKTSVAERIMRAFPDTIWIPRTVMIGSDIIHLFDSAVHQEVETPSREPDAVDRRWVQIKRPTVIAGGELMLSHFEIRPRMGAGVLEAPLQMKANCGALVIDDFGRNRVEPTELLNRLIVPLDRNIDFVTLPNGRQVRIPFEQLLILSTNINPKDLVDEAFLRRIPFKIRMPEPNEAQFREVFQRVGARMQIECSPEMVDYLVHQHFHGANREFRFCQPRDILFLVGNNCSLAGSPRRLTKENIDSAINNYFVGV